MDDQRRLSFEFLVLRGIWAIILMLSGMRNADHLIELRGDMVGYFDEHGRQGEAPREYRRKVAFPYMYPIDDDKH